jgi:signal-transduction protein with cAMP-binding, CBS, and nucleotidyltransferase domain
MVNNVSEIMTAKLETIELDHSSQKAAKMMSDKKISSLVVVDDGGRAVGIVTERDLVRKVCAQDSSSKDFMVKDVMSSPIVTIDSSSSIENAVNTMITSKLRHLVVSEGNQTMGIISSTNLINYLNSQIDMDDVNARILSALSEEP